MKPGDPPTLSRYQTVTLGSCPACDAAGGAPFAVKGEVRLVECHSCGLVYANPQPRDQMLEAYTTQIDLARHFGTWAPRKRVLFERRLMALPVPTPAADRLCDVGCGDGQFLELAQRMGWAPAGIELNPPAADRAQKRGYDVLEGRFERMELPWGSYDLVTAWDVLEHSPEPRDFMTRLFKLARPGGTVAITTLNRRSLAWKVFGTRWSMVDEDCFTYWDRSSLETLVALAGGATRATHFFGLGRDFVMPLDRLLRSPAARSPRVAGASGGRRWDTSAATLWAERALNNALDATGTGVGILVVATAGARSGAATP